MNFQGPERFGQNSQDDRKRNVSLAAEHLEGRKYLVGERFTVADAYFGWALLLLGHGGVDVAQWPSLVAYLERFQPRP